MKMHLYLLLILACPRKCCLNVALGNLFYQVTFLLITLFLNSKANSHSVRIQLGQFSQDPPFPLMFPLVISPH